MLALSIGLSLNSAGTNLADVELLLSGDTVSYLSARNLLHGTLLQ